MVEKSPQKIWPGSRMQIAFVFALCSLLGSSKAIANGSPEVCRSDPAAVPLCLWGCPKGTASSNDLVLRAIYTLSSNDVTKFADWVAYRVTAATIGPTQKRAWKADPCLTDKETLEPPDYSKAHALLSVDRGHQAPLASLAGTPYWKQANYLSNITPQKSALNRGPWKRLEGAVRRAVKSHPGKIAHVSTGPLYERQMPGLPMPKGKEAHKIPSGYWKVVIIEADGRYFQAAFVFDQDTPAKDRFCSHQTSIREIEQRSGLRLFFKKGKRKPAALKCIGRALVWE